jgi:hypothetical protein
MANHLRRQIREGIATAITGLTTTSTRVFQSRVYPLEVADLPGLLVRSSSEVVEVMTIHAPRLQQRSVNVEVVAVARAVADLDDTLDGICKEVEIALAMPISALAGIAKNVTLAGTEIELTGGAEKPVGTATMTYVVEYFALENAPDVAQ